MIKTCCFISILSAHKASFNSSAASSGVLMAPPNSLISALSVTIVNHFLWLDLVDLNGPEINEMIKALVGNNIPVRPILDIYRPW
jgi:hypothetical protein